MFSFLEGWKTRLLAFATVVLGGLDLVDPSLLSTALGYGPQGRAAIVVIVGVAIFVLRQITKTPAPPLVRRR